MEKRAKLAEEFGSVEAFAGKGSLYKRSSTYPKKAVQGAVRYGLEKCWEYQREPSEKCL